MSDRIADSTIKGFLYQFNKTILGVANADDEDVISVEGVVENVDVLSAGGELEAIQCKHHESSEKFIPSLIFKPLLQMAEAFDKNLTARIKGQGLSRRRQREDRCINKAVNRHGIFWKLTKTPTIRELSKLLGFEASMLPVDSQRELIR